MRRESTILLPQLAAAVAAAMFLASLLTATPVQAAPPTWRTPAPGSPERKQIMDAMRPPFEKSLGGKLVFKVKELRVTDTHAFASVAPVRPDGRPYQIVVDGPMDAYGEAILQRRGAGWALLDWNMGATDVWYCELTARGVPKSILPYC